MSLKHTIAVAAIAALLAGMLLGHSAPLGPTPNPGHSGEEIANGSISGEKLADNLTINDTFFMVIGRAAGVLVLNGSSGYVGIGTTAPDRTLTVKGETWLKGIGGDILQFYNSAGTRVGQVQNDGTTVLGGSGEPANMLDVGGSLAVGSGYIGTAAPSNGAIIQGNVGIGTTSPGQKLTVNGIIESISGGFKFPDGTTQTTSAVSKIYDSGWFSVAAQSNYVLTHNLGTTKLIIELQCKATDGTIGKCRYWDWDGANPSGVLLTGITTTQFIVRTSRLVCMVDDHSWGSGATDKAAEYIRVIAMALP